MKKHIFSLFTLVFVLGFSISFLHAQETDMSSKVKRIFNDIGMNTQISGPFRDGEFIDQRTNEPFFLKNFYDEKFQLISFGATWCPPCIEELPTLQRLTDELSDEKEYFAYHMVYVQENKNAVSNFLAQYDYSFTNLRDESGTRALQNNVRGIPTTFLIDPDGNIVFSFFGGNDWGKSSIVMAIRNAINTWWDLEPYS